jgi:hypothetical protein
MKTTKIISELGHSTESKESILQICKQRKKLGFQTLKTWNENTKHELQMSKEFIEELFMRLEVLLNESSKRIITITQFLSQWFINIGTQMKFASNMKLFCLDRDQPLDSLYALPWEKLQETEPMLYAMLELNREYEVFSQKLREVQKRIKKDIIDKYLGKSISPYEKTVKQLKSQSQNTNKLLMKRAQNSIDKLKKLEKTYQDNIVDENKKRRVRKNMFDVAFEFAQGVKSVDNSLADFGLLLIANWEQCKALEEKRITATRNSLIKFMDLMNEIFGEGAQENFRNR